MFANPGPLQADFLKLLAAILFGVLTHVLKKLGPSVIVFVYLYFSQYTQNLHLDKLGTQIPINVALVFAVSVLSVFVLVFRNSVFATGHRLDAACLPLLDQFSLKFLHGYDLKIPRLRAKSVTVLEIGKTVALFAVLVAIACTNSIYLGAIVAIIVLAIFLATNMLPRADQLNGWPRAKTLFEPDNYCELILIIGLLVGFLFVLPKGTSLLSGAVILLVVARFSGPLKLLGRRLRHISRWRSVVVHNAVELVQKMQHLQS